MKRRSIFQALMAAIPLALIGRKAEAEAATETYEFKGLSLGVAYSAYPCPECGELTLVYGPVNQDFYTCDTCGATVGAFEVIAGHQRHFQTLDYAEEDSFQYYSGYEPLNYAGPPISREPSPWWRNR